MKIAVIGANGKAGRLIVSEAVRRGAEVTAVVRSDNRSETPHVIQKRYHGFDEGRFEGF